MGRSPTAAPQTTLVGTMASCGSGSVSVRDGSAFQPLAKGNYFVVGGTEVVLVTSIVGNTVTFTSRGQFGTTAQ